MAHWSIIAAAGPAKELQELFVNVQQHADFDKLVKVPISDDYGEFPDTSGYDRKDFQQAVAQSEDPALYRYMLQCIDAVAEYISKKQDHATNLCHGEVESFMHWPKFGGKIFVVTGHVVVKSACPVTISKN
jgi:hypothetical protein